MKKVNITLIFLVMVLVANAQIYHEDDKEGLRLFLAQPSAIEGKTNGEQLGLTPEDMQFWQDNEDWVSKVYGLTWNDDSPKRLISVVWNVNFAGFRRLAGVLDATQWEKLTYLDVANEREVKKELFMINSNEELNIQRYGKALTNLYVSGCFNLNYLSCSDHFLTNLDLSGCFNLKILSCSSNLLTTLDVSECINLQSLWCSDNYLKNLDVSGCTNLEYLYCNPSPFSQNNWLKNLNASGCTNLLGLYCNNNFLTNLDISGCTNLQSLWCYGNLLSNLELSGCTNLKSLWCYENLLTNLDISGYNDLLTLYCSNNLLTNLDVSGCNNLQNLNCDNNFLTKLDVSGLTNLQSLSCYNNFLTNLDVSELTNLQSLSCYNNFLTILDVSRCINLRVLGCEINSLTNLNVSGCDDLRVLYCSNNLLTDLNVSSNTELRALTCFKNQLSFLDLSENIFLQNVYCYDNRLKLSNLYYISENIVSHNSHWVGTQILLPQTVVIGEEVDFSSESVLGGVETVFVVHKNGENAVTNEDYAITNGIITFYEEGTYTVTMTNDAIVSHPNYPAKVIAEFLCISSGIFNDVQEQTLKGYVQNGILYISGLSAGEKWRVYNVAGVLVAEGGRQEAEGEEEIVMLPGKGIYIIKTESRQLKIVF